MTARLTLNVAPSSEPLSVDLAKIFCRCNHDKENELFTGWIKSAREHVESISLRQLLPATWRLQLPGFPPYHDLSLEVILGGSCQSIIPISNSSDEIDLPRTPVVTASVSYYDASNVQQTWDSSKWLLTGDQASASIKCVDTESWPETYRRDDALQVDFQAGYGATAIPQEFVTAIQFLVDSSYRRLPWSQQLLDAVDNILATKITRRYS